ncbi:predicted protein [Histoplasma mississippiense (nom. inval.)]|uniref:predicted protein n=1 Tax=Ajellomyces capsulatus (strain NAm1 / WU24) TaxID=2059318 RepID=UPI000157D505|nr:predicted protein [Histoplasma mississippiense (nom. inval.)]EDN05403.1 predicted protein [Histoplasma mississippiense (nom. inval.)]
MDGFEDDDPFEWSIDQVIAHLCHSSAPWARSSLPRPDSTTLETSLRENDVTGEILLTEINKVTLAQDLGLKSLGQRATIFRAVEELQKRSRKYAEYTQSRQVNPSYPIETTPQIAPSSSRPPETPFHAIPSAGDDPAAHSRMTTVSQSPSKASEAQRQEKAYLAATGSASVNCRSNEAYVIDRTGKKRRKLFLRQLQSHRTGTWEEDSGINRSSAYLGPTKVTLPDLFYNNMEDSDDEAFVLEGAKCPIGQKRFVNKRVQHYFLEEHFSIQTKEGKNAVAIFPYSSKILPPGELQFFTLFTQDQGIVKVTKEDIIDWPQFKERDEFDYLLDKYPTEAGQGLPPYGDSGSENEYDSDTWQEIKLEEQEVEVEKQKSKILSGPEVDGIIDRYIELTSRKWCDQKLPIHQRKAQRLWLSSRKRDTKYSEIKSAQSTIAHLERRLKSLRKAIKDTSWSKVNEVQQQCQSMEETLFNKEAQKWKISVLELDTCPPKPPSAAAPAKRPKPSIPEDEEWLSSEGNDEDIDDINDFIVPDNDVPVSDRSGDKREPSRTAPTLPREAQVSEDVPIPRSLREQHVQNSSSSEPRSVRQRSAEHVLLKNSTSPAPLREMKQYLHGPIEVVDLTKSSDETSDHNFDIQTPPLNPVNDTALPPPSPRSQLLHDFTRVKKQRQGTSELQVLDPVYIAETARIGWSVLEERLDRDRLLSKLIWSMPQQERRDLHQLTNSIELEKAKKRVRKALRSVLHHSYQIQNSRKHTLFLRIAALYTSWLRCKKISAMQGIPKAFIEGTLRDKISYDVFHPKLCEALRAFSDVKDPVTKAAAGKPPEISTNKSDEPERSTSSQISGAEQTQDQDLQELSSGSEIEAHRTPHKKRKRAVKESQEAMDSQRNAQRRVELQEKQREQLARRLRGTGISNTDPERQVVSFDDPVIYLHRHIGARVKPHQLSGIQFMWRELIKDEKRQGCLLAHTMGLGKTMQVISLLVTIANAAASDDPRVRNQIPKALRRSRTLVLCPSSLIENWWEELLMWTPSDSQTSRNIGPFRKILPTLQLEERLDGIASWYMDGDWIAPGYLGDFVQFKAKYIEPIQEGLYADSSQWERRQSLKKLQVLKKDIDPKLNRADISVLKGSLPPKVEFVITVPLTPLQEQAYNTYVAALAANNDTAGNPKLWDWLSILSLLCNHPGCFMEKLRDRSKGFQKPPSSLVSPDSDSEIPEDPSIPHVLLSSEVLARIEKDFPTGMDMWSLELSHRAQVADQIIERSIAAGDKVLLFSHSIPTLNYLELVLKQAKRSYSRLDGKTPIATRQIATKNFNSGFDSQVYLISTRAGGLGLNIPGANRVIIFDFQFNPTWEEQAVGRAYRLGQLKPVYVYRFLAGGTYEDVMHNRAVFKTQLAFRVVDKKNPIRWASKNISDYLFSPKFVPQKDLSEFKGKDPAVLDRILAGQKNIRKIALTETFQREDNDKLTPEEEKAVQEELDDERLKRNDPVAWAKKQQVQEPQATPRRSIFPHSHPLSVMRSAQHLSSYRASDLVSLSADSIPPMTSLAVGPPALTPDTSLFRPANQPRFTNETRVLSSFFSDINGNAAPTPLVPSQASLNGPLLPNGDANQPSIPPPPPAATAAIASSSNIPSSSKVDISQKRPNNVDKDDGHVTGTSNASKHLTIGQENQVETNAVSAVGKESETPQSKTV